MFEYFILFKSAIILCKFSTEITNKKIAKQRKTKSIKIIMQ